MSVAPIAIQRVGLVTAVGLSAPESCAAFRAKISNPTQTRFIDSNGEWIMAHQVPLAQPWRGLTKLAKMAAMAIEEALRALPRPAWAELPLLLCVAERERPGRQDGLDERLFDLIASELGAPRFAPGSVVIAAGRVGVAYALARARQWLMASGKSAMTPHVLVVATDSLLSWPTLSHYEQRDRLLSARNANGFMPGEAGGALLLGRPSGQGDELLCAGIGFGQEAAHIDSEEPLRADGLAGAIGAALAEAGSQIHEMDFRITDVSGEQYYFKEAALALSRLLRVRKEEFDIWHPAECTGELGAASGVAVLAAAKAACEKHYTQGHRILAHAANDAGQRAALALRYQPAAAAA